MPSPHANPEHSQQLRSLFDKVERAWGLARDYLRDQQTSEGCWAGELSTSALSTATAVSALAQSRKSNCVVEPQRVSVDDAIVEGCQWLSRHQNSDGGFGDTDRSHSNIATSLLVLAAWELANSLRSNSEHAENRWPPNIDEQKRAAWEYVEQHGKWEGLHKRYGKDKTFVVPILSNCALADFVPWTEVPPLPFEAAWLPQDLYRWARMPVVSYAVPALVAIGQARFHFAPPKNPLLRILRRWAVAPTLRVLRCMQPASGGYLEATPLTSFVLMSLAAAGNGHLPVARECLRFIMDSRLSDGSWPIDTNLATWLTSLSIHALTRRGKVQLQYSAGIDARGASEAAKAPFNTQTNAIASAGAESLVTGRTVRWLLACQHRKRHPFAGANPGGWGWTNLSGAVPDADDTPAALLALHAIDWRQPELMRLSAHAHDAVGFGLGWLLRLQNSDGGWPTFCRGWGKLPFDRSGTDLTAHALRALEAWLPQLEHVRDAAGPITPRRTQIETAKRRALEYLSQTQNADGSWNPLWFGNQDRPAEDNPVYGTGKVLLALGSLGLHDSAMARQGIAYLHQNRNEDGGWGGGPSVQYVGFPTKPEPFHCSTIEETAVALEGLLSLEPLTLSHPPEYSGREQVEQPPLCCGLYGGQVGWDGSIMQALDWLANAVESGNLQFPSPIGFYFAKLWYHERLYPAIFSLSALGAAIARKPSCPIPEGGDLT